MTRADPSRVYGWAENGLFVLYETDRAVEAGHVVLMAKLVRGAPVDALWFRVGEVIRVRRRGGSLGTRVDLVVSFITPLRYYRPGSRVTACLIGVRGA